MSARKRKQRTSLYIVVLVVGIVLSFLAVEGYYLRADCQKKMSEKAQLQAKKERLLEEREQIKKDAAYMQTDEYIEDVAREKFGLVYEDEIIFKPEENE